MKRLLFLRIVPLLLPGLLVVLAAQTPKPGRLEQTLRVSRWKQRVLLVVAPSAKHPDFRQQKALLTNQAAGLAARDFRVLDVLYDELSDADTQFLVREIGLQPPAFATVIIGKDGGVKAQSPRPMAPAALFSTVDKMPMRQAEIRQSRHHQPPK
ncbi:DUF4174 domain-containing protein [Hymenobacter sp. BT664]|uniref:DUF4174 domain-containing protein n=1 Tax=Hymenobacter montanus TaxID=2771359 RepID=A0A927BGE8_9BACT|nr:DUF4174 domain-containing protein [Hymenobacter montanus]MBD2770421.1 DUF4174 domain-containing protein [Hymenobacter montanus]